MSKTIKWYRRHRKAVGAILEIACDAVPTAGVLKPFLNVAEAIDEDAEKEELKQKIVELETGQAENQAQFEKLLGVVMQIPELRDIVEEVEENAKFNANLSKDEVVDLIENDQELFDDLRSTVPQISGDLTASVQYFQNINSQKDHGKYNYKNEEENERQDTVNNGYLIGKYRLEERVGGGGQGEVYRAFNEIAEKEVALKILPAELSMCKESLEGIKNDYRNLTANLSHRFIVQYRDLDYCRDRNRWFLVMDYIQGTTLRSTIINNSGQQMSSKTIYNMLSPVAEALEYAHKQGISHNDVKPENILVGDDGNVMLTDFGLSEQIKNTVSTVSGKGCDMRGTWPYMAPEQLRGRRTSGATDVWAMGVVIYEMAAGKHPFRESSLLEYFRAICERGPEPLENKALWKVLKQAFVKDKKKRMKSPVELIEQIKEVNDSYSGRRDNKQRRGIKAIEDINSMDAEGVLADVREEIAEIENREFLSKEYQHGYRVISGREFSLSLKKLGLISLIGIVGIMGFNYYEKIQYEKKRQEMKQRIAREKAKRNTAPMSKEMSDKKAAEKYLRRIDRSRYASIEKEKQFSSEVLEKINMGADYYAKDDMLVAKEYLEKHKKGSMADALYSAVQKYKSAAKYGDIEAMYYLGELSLKGDKKLYVEQDVKRAREYFRLAAFWGSKKAEDRLININRGVIDELANSKNILEIYEAARIYEKGEGVNKDYNKAIALYKKTADENHGDSIYRLAAIYHRGKMSGKELREISNFYERLGEEGKIKPLDTLLGLYVKEYKKNKESWVKKNINNLLEIYWENHRNSLSPGKIKKLAYFSRKVHIRPNDKLRQYQWHETLANMGDTNAMYICGQIYSQYRSEMKRWGYGDVDPNSWFVRASEKGHLKSTQTLAQMYEKKGTKEELKKALELYKKIEKRLGLQHKVREIESRLSGKKTTYTSSSTKRNTIKSDNIKPFNIIRESPQESVKYLTQANKYFAGITVGKNYEKSRELYLKAAELGNVEAMYQLGLMYTYGNEIKKNLDQAKIYLKYAHREKNIHATNMLGVVYYMQNDSKARDLFLEASYQRYSPATNNLGNIYYYGKGVTKDIDRAMECYKKAGAQNNMQAYYNLGAIYYTGKHNNYNGMTDNQKRILQKSDNTQAKIYLRLAGAILKYQPALELLKVVERYPNGRNIDLDMKVSYTKDILK